MKLSKRIAAGFLAAAMMATMAFPAFADTTPTNYYYTVSSGKWQVAQNATTATSAPGISKTYNAPNGWKFATETLHLTASATEASKALGTTGITYPETVPTFSEVSVTENFNGGTFSIASMPTYSKIGTYVYEVTENSTSTKQTGTEYMNAFYMKVQVTAHEEGEDNNKHVVQDAYDVYVTYYTKSENGLGQKITTVTNKVTTNTTPDPGDDKTNGSPLDVSKIVKGTAKTDGSAIDPETEYTITVTITAPTAAEGETATAVNLENVAVTVGTSSNTATTPAQDVVTKGENGTWTIKLKANEHAYFSNVPLGATYTVAESEQSGANFTVAYAYKTGNTTDAANASHVISKDGNTAVVTNQGKGIQVDTGVILDNAPYIVMIAVVAAAAVVFVISKKRREE